MNIGDIYIYNSLKNLHFYNFFIEFLHSTRSFRPNSTSKNTPAFYNFTIVSGLVIVLVAVLISVVVSVPMAVLDYVLVAVVVSILVAILASVLASVLVTV